jgi:tetratricopeptide (TPR) repeat protein
MTRDQESCFSALRHLALIALIASCAIGCQSAPSEDADWFDGGPLRPATAETLQLTARVLAAKGSSAQAGFILNRMAAEYPDYLGTYTEGAEVLLVEGRVAEAIAWIDRGIARMPDNAILLNDRGMCHLLASDLPAATRDFKAAYLIDPGDADYVSNLALARALAGHEELATELWSRVLSAAEVRDNLQVCRRARSNFKQSE